MAFAQDTAHPPWAFALEAAMFGDGVDSCAVTPDTVLVMAIPVMAEPSSFQAVMVHNEIPIRMFSVKKAWTSSAIANYYLRC
jgi:hypothetical protein